jgi:putative endonuclease
MAVAFATAMPDAASRVSTGKRGEDLACAELERRGYAILARRYRSRFGEIDIVSQDGPVIVFVEVRARRTRERGEAAETLTARKRRRIGAMALDYLAYTGKLDSPCRFDVVAIDGIGTPGMELRVIPDAFWLDGGGW